MVEQIDAGLPPLEMRRGNPFCAAVFTLARLPAAGLNERMMAAAAKGQIVDVGRAADVIVGDMVDLAVVAGCLAPGV